MPGDGLRHLFQLVVICSAEAQREFEVTGKRLASPSTKNMRNVAAIICRILINYSVCSRFESSET